MEANDDGITPLKTDSYYNQLIIAAIADLESHMGKLSIRDNSYQFTPLRIDKEIQYKDDGITPEIDSELYYDPDDTDDHSPVDIYVSKGLRVATGKEKGTIETADFLDAFGIMLKEPDIAFIKIDADVSFTDPDKVEFDVSFDNRETYLVEDYDIEIELEEGTTGFIDVSRIPSGYIALKWILTGDTAIVRNTTFWRYYITKDQLRHYAQDVIELAKMRLLEIKLDKAIKNQNDPMVIAGMQAQIQNIRQKYGLNKSAGDTKPSTGGYGISYYPGSREENKVFGFSEKSEDLLSDKRVIGITSSGEIRRT